MKKKSICIGFGMMVVCAVAVGFFAKKDDLRFDSSRASIPTRKILNWNPSADTLSQTNTQTAPTNSGALTVTQLNDLANEVQSALPHLADLKNLSEEEVHQVAKPIFAGALQLKRYADQLEIAMKATPVGSAEYKELATEGVHFYETCASGEQTPESIRAVCYVGFLKSSSQSGRTEEIMHLRMPPDVLRIALAIAK